METLLREDYDLKRRAYHETRLQLARLGISADPAIIIRAQDLAAELVELEARLGITQSVVMTSDLPYRLRQRRSAELTAEELRQREAQHQARITAEQQGARHKDAEHHLNLLKIHRANLAHYRAQAKAFGGVEFAMPITRHGIGEARAGISDTKAALRALGIAVDDLPGDE